MLELPYASKYTYILVKMGQLSLFIGSCWCPPASSLELNIKPLTERVTEFQCWIQHLILTIDNCQPAGSAVINKHSNQAAIIWPQGRSSVLTSLPVYQCHPDLSDQL